MPFSITDPPSRRGITERSSDVSEGLRKAADGARSRAEEAAKVLDQARQALDAARRAGFPSDRIRPLEVAVQNAQRTFLGAQQAANVAIRWLNLTAKESNPLPFDPAAARDRFSPSRPTNFSGFLGEASAPATEAVSEKPSRGGETRASCREQAESWLSKSTPAFRSHVQLVFFKDKREESGDGAGLMLIKRQGQFTDPTTQPPQTYDSVEVFKRTRPEYREEGHLPAATANKIFSGTADPSEHQQAVERLPNDLRRLLGLG